MTLLDDSDASDFSEAESKRAVPTTDSSELVKLLSEEFKRTAGSARYEVRRYQQSLYLRIIVGGRVLIYQVPWMLGP